MNVLTASFDAVDFYVLAAIGLLTLCSFLSRALYFLFGEHMTLSDNVRQALRYAPVAALTAIIVPALAPWDQGWYAFIATPWLAALATVAVYVVTRSTLMVMAGGMLAYWLLRYVPIALDGSLL